jgi:hypothetical protein
VGGASPSPTPPAMAAKIAPIITASAKRRVRVGHGDDQSLALNELGTIPGMDIGVQHGGCVLETPGEMA